MTRWYISTLKTNMTKENVGLKFRPNKYRWNMKLSLKEIKHYAFMSKKQKKLCRTLNYFKHFLLFISAVTGSVSISAFPSLVSILVCITSSAVWLKTCTMTAEIKKYKSVIKRKKKMHDKISRKN